VTLHIHPFDQYGASEEEIARVHELWCLFDAEYFPDDPPMPLAQRIAEFRRVRPHRLQPKWVAEADGGLVGLSGAWIDTDRDDKNVFGMVFVRPDARGRGYARPLARAMIEAAAEAGRDVVVTEIVEDSPEIALAEAIGLKPVLKERISRLRIADLDRDLMQKWIDRASERASDYEIIIHESPMPDDVAEKFVVVHDVMNTAPLEELEEAPEKMTVEHWQQMEQGHVGAGETLLTCIAVHRPTGDYGGFTVLKYQTHHPAKAHQYDTGVDPGHRNKGLGRWIKAANILEFTSRFPDVQWIDTGNAGSNEPMLNINYEMGFKTECVIQVYQGPMEPVRSWADGG
jgi:GNAT superfamily N-acetyltransferase